MPIRPFKLPKDLTSLAEVANTAFQYPENETWSIQEDEREGIVETLQNARRMWPILRTIMIVSPLMWDIVRGFVWEEDGRPVGISQFQNPGSTGTWSISTIAVLPEYRRRGIGRKLVLATIDYIRQRGGRVVKLAVINGNVPAYALYESVGFKHYGGEEVLNYLNEMPPETARLPDGYSVTPLRSADWRRQYELALRTTPAPVQAFEPVDIGRYRLSVGQRALFALFERAQGTQQTLIGVQTSQGELVATASLHTRKRPGGINKASIALNPAHPGVASYVVREVARRSLQESPGRRLETESKSWMAPVTEAALGAGYVARLEYHLMGFVIDEAGRSARTSCSPSSA